MKNYVHKYSLVFRTYLSGHPYLQMYALQRNIFFITLPYTKYVLEPIFIHIYIPTYSVYVQTADKALKETSVIFTLSTEIEN